jgi:hypothetical protein
MKDSSSLSTFVSKTLHSSARFTETERRRATSIPKTLRSSARFTETERSRATSSIALILSLLLISPCLAWDDDDTDSNSFHQSNIQHQESKITRTSVIDYGYKNTYQANPSQRTSVIDFGGPKRLSQADDDNDSKPFSQSRIQHQESKITYSQPQQAYEDSRTRALHVDTIQEANDKRALRNAELMAESQRRFEKQEADQERSRAQMAKQQSIYDEMDQEECEMAEFVGGVFKAKFGATTGRNSAITSEGYIFRSGDNFITPRGIYSKDRDIYAGPDGITTQTSNLFFGNNGTTIQAGGAYFTDGRSGYVVGPNCRNTSTWRSR